MLLWNRYIDAHCSLYLPPVSAGIHRSTRLAAQAPSSTRYMRFRPWWCLYSQETILGSGLTKHEHGIVKLFSLPRPTQWIVDIIRRYRGEDDILDTLSVFVLLLTAEVDQDQRSWNREVCVRHDYLTLGLIRADIFALADIHIALCVVDWQYDRMPVSVIAWRLQVTVRYPVCDRAVLQISIGDKECDGIWYL